MTEPTELLPCPFCGSKATASVNQGESLWSHDVVDWTRVHCTNDDCNAQTEATCEGYEPSAIEVWNRRTPPAVAGEPVGYLYCGGSYGDELEDWEIVADQHQCDKLNEHHGSLGKEARLPLYATPQPTQAQAGAVPMTDEQIKVINTRTLGYLHFALAIERAHSIGIKKGDSHD